NGHVDYCNLARGLRFVSESAWRSEPERSYLESQTIEFDADSSATGSAIAALHHRVSHPERMPSWRTAFFHDREAAFFDLAVAICVYARLFGDERITGEKLRQSFHPPMRWRQMMILTVMSN